MNAKRNQNHRSQASNSAPSAPVQEATETILLLRGYVPKNATVLSQGGVVKRSLGQGQFEYDTVDATLEKLPKGTEVDLPKSEATALIRAGKACVAEHATDSQLIQAGLKRPDPVEAEELV